MRNQADDIVLVAVARTPFGRFEGTFKDIEAPRLGALAIDEILARCGTLKDEIGALYAGVGMIGSAVLTPVRQAVLLSAVVQQGIVSASCPRSLSQNVQPFWAASIDVDGDGRCSPADVGVMRLEFAWPPGGFSRTFPSMERLAWSPVGSLVGVDRPDGSKTQFCEDLFGAPAPD